MSTRLNLLLRNHCHNHLNRLGVYQVTAKPLLNDLELNWGRKLSGCWNIWHNYHPTWAKVQHRMWQRLIWMISTYHRGADFYWTFIVCFYCTLCFLALLVSFFFWFLAFAPYLFPLLRCFCSLPFSFVSLLCFFHSSLISCFTYFKLISPWVIFL